MGGQFLGPLASLAVFRYCCYSCLDYIRMLIVLIVLTIVNCFYAQGSTFFSNHAYGYTQQLATSYQLVGSIMTCPDRANQLAACQQLQKVGNQLVTSFQQVGNQSVLSSFQLVSLMEIGHQRLYVHAYYQYCKYANISISLMSHIFLCAKSSSPNLQYQGDVSCEIITKCSCLMLIGENFSFLSVM